MKSSNAFTLAKPFLLLAVFSYLLISGGCASLPRAEKIVQESTNTEGTPTIVGARRQLSRSETKALIKRLRGQTLPTDILGRHITVEEAISGTPLVAGNKVTLLVDGPGTYAAMSMAIQKAREHINLETFIFEADAAGRRFSDLLLQKAAEGVQVNLIYDAFGSIETPSAFFRHLSHGGIQVLKFNPLNPLQARGIWLLAHRDHRKILIADGSIAITGGVNITNVYSGSSFDSDDREHGKMSWRDTDVQIEGPAVAEFQKLFLDTWRREKGPELANRDFFPIPNHRGTDLVRVIGSSPGMTDPNTYLMYFAAISFALNSIHLTSSYFAPDEQMLNALTEAAERGVDVKIILPAKSDSEMVYYAGRSHYSRLLKSGVKLYERRNTILHAKTAVIDNVWSSVGSTNLELWSFLRNDEVNAVILGRDFADQMEAMFTRDLDNSDRIHLESWEQRSLHERMRELFSRLFAYWL
jgi:cardiolipin synthase A/B